MGSYKVAQKSYPSQLVYGLDIGTRSIVGTVGYRKGKKFVVVALTSIEHETRAMMDGQIHDIKKVAATVKKVTAILEKKTGVKLDRVCIAAAGRVLKTVLVHTNIDFEDDKIVDEEDIYTLNSLAIEEAYKQFLDNHKSDIRFYCVGNSVVKYYLNDTVITNLENHKARTIGVDLIATFLPDDVVDSLNKAIDMAGLEIASLTLEPIAAIGLAIPEKFRLLNIALVDVGAGTSDISVTKDGSIIAFGMIPTAGDKLTETIANGLMVDFNTAEYIKREASVSEEIKYTDIMGLDMTVSREEVEKIVADVVDELADLASQKIIELNGGKSVGAVFVVGGGGAFKGYTERLADKLGISKDRVALRGKEVMNDIVFKDKKINVDSLLVTPIGIALSFYEETNNFIYINFNGDKVKIYKSQYLTVMDVAMQTDFPADGFFPKSGKAVHYTLNGSKKMARGLLGEPAIIKVNGELANMNTPVKENDIVEVIESVPGEPANIAISNLGGFKESIKIFVNDMEIKLPKFASVNGELESGYYILKDGDKVEILDYYTVEQVAQFMDIIPEEGNTCFVNNKPADEQTKIYENFSVYWKLTDGKEENVTYDDLFKEDSGNSQDIIEQPVSINVLVNGAPVLLEGKSSYVFVDIFDKINFDLTKPQGNIVTKRNGNGAEYMEQIFDGDVIEVFWEK